MEQESQAYQWNKHVTTFVSKSTECVHMMWVKAKILVRGVRQMSCNEIPDIWKVAVRRFSRVQSIPSCLSQV